MLRSWSNVRRSVSSTSTLEVYTATRRLPVAGTPVRRFAGVPICCVERWNLRQRLAGRRSPVAGRRYAALPVYQTVVLNVGI